MTIAELFVNLGVKGDGEAKKSLKGVDEGLSNIKSMSIEAKAAILAVVYGLKQMMSQSMQTGQDLTNFNALTGLSTQRLEQYEQAGARVGLVNGEMAKTFVNVQKAQAAMKLEGKGFDGLGAIASRMKGFDYQKFLKDPEYAIQMVGKFARDKTVPTDISNALISKMGLENLIPAFRRNAFSEAQLKKGVVYSDKSRESLAKVDGMWKDLETKFEHGMGNFMAKHGEQLMTDLTKLADAFLTLAEAVAQLSEKSGFFNVVTGATKLTAAGITAASKPEETGKTMLGWLREGAKQNQEWMRSGKSLNDFAKSKMQMQDAVNMFKKNQQMQIELKHPSSAGGRTPQSEGPAVIEKSGDVTNNFHFEINNKDPMETATKVKEVVHTFNLYPKTQAT